MPGLCALHCLGDREAIALSASSTTSDGSSCLNSARRFVARLFATRSCSPSRWNGGAVKCRNSSLLFETRTFGTSNVVQRYYRMARRMTISAISATNAPPIVATPRTSVPAIVGLALGGQLLDLRRARRDRAAEAIDALVQLAELRVLDAVEVDERAERDEPALDLGLGERDLARLALLLGVELGEPVGVALARVVEAALGGIELGLRRVEPRGRLADRPLERG